MSVRRLAQNLLLLGVSSVGLLVVLEVAGRVFFHDLLDVVNDVDHRMDPVPGSVNGDGIRSSLEAGAYGPEAFSVLVLGDSFVMGLGLGPGDTMPAVLERILRRRRPDLDARVWNFGWISASPLLSHRQVREIGAKYHPDLVVACVDMTDFQDDIKYGKFLDRRGVFALAPIAPATFLAVRKIMSAAPPLRGLHRAVFGFPARRFFVSDAPIAENARYMEELWRNVTAMASFVMDSLGARFAVAALPRTYQYSDRESPENWEAGEYEPLGPYATEPIRFLLEKGRGAPFPVFSLLESFLASEVFPTARVDDPHWTPAGAALAAEAISDALARLGLLERPSASTRAPEPSPRSPPTR